MNAYRYIIVAIDPDTHEFWYFIGYDGMGTRRRPVWFRAEDTNYRTQGHEYKSKSSARKARANGDRKYGRDQWQWGDSHIVRIRGH